MATTILESHSNRCKTLPKYYDFHSFAASGCPITLTGPFRDNVRRFLQECAEIEHNLDGMPVWRTLLVYESKVLPLYTIEEDVHHSFDRPFCNHCRSVGWSHHFVSKRKYHLIIPANDEWDGSIDEGILDLQTHILHGMIHCNGLGHLVCINGIEGGSTFIRGEETMDLWDRICMTLGVRKVTVEDLSKKHQMDLRLLYGVAYGQSWFGKWGYRFFSGSFGVKEHNYEIAMGLLSSFELDQVIKDFCLVYTCSGIKQIVHHYRDMSVTSLVTIRDLFRFMLTLKLTTPTCTKVAFSTPIRRCSLKSPNLPLRSTPFRKEKPTKLKKFSNIAAKMDSRWPVRRLEHVAEIIVEALKEKRAVNKACNSGMTRQEARDAARLHVGDTGLIDHVLKAMNNVVVGNCIVCRSVNRSTKILEYTIQDLKADHKLVPKVEGPISTCSFSPGRDVYYDVFYLYTNVLLHYPESEPVQLAAQTVLHSKHFVKEFPFRDEDDESLKFMCRLILSPTDLNADVSYDFKPMEYVFVPLYATVGDLKIAVQDAFRDTYCVLENVLVTEILELEGVEDEEVLFGIVESGMELRVKGSVLDVKDSLFLRCEGGNEKWTVKCKCGARDDDGERMLACDICEVWQHTQCCGIEEAEAVPKLFVCETCCCSLIKVQSCGLAYNYNSYDYEGSFAADSCS